jgi:hypothetical protein
MDAWRMREKDLPVLEHQETELRQAGEALDNQRPGARQDLHTALRHETPIFRAMMELEGAQRTRGLLGGIEHEERIRRDPNLVSGKLAILMDDGTEFVAGPGDVTSLPKGHDAWVVGDDPVVVIDWFGASNYAKQS